MTQLTPHFSLEEMTFSETAVRLGLDNSPSLEVIRHLQELAEAMETVRELLGVAIHVQSAYRSPAVNKAVGGKSTSAHLSGWACDFTAPGYGSPREICEAIIDAMLPFDQLIWEYSAWVHLSVDPARMRQEVLTINENGTTEGLA